MSNEHKSSSSDLDQDPNYIAYKSQEAQLKENHMGKFVAFYEGQLVGVEDNYETLCEKVVEKIGTTGFLYKEIKQEERVFHIRGPRLKRS